MCINVHLSCILLHILIQLGICITSTQICNVLTPLHTIGDSLTQFQNMDMDAPICHFLHMHINADNWRLQFLQQ